MKTLTRNLCLLLPMCFSLSSVYAGETHWGYQGDHGPSHWGEFGGALCSNGTQQSPINIDMKQVRPLKGNESDLKIRYGAAALKLVNNGHTVQANVTDGESVTFKGDEYRLVQFHFHTPSEHQINHRSYPMEMHLVNQHKDGRLLVLGLMLAEGKDNIQFAQLLKQLPSTEGKEVLLDAKSAPNLNALLPATSHHVFYRGSLTTPPCTEGVQWVLFEQSIELSKDQIQEFQNLFPDNHRPPQILNKREVEED